MIKVIGGDKLVAKFAAGAVASQIAVQVGEETLAEGVLRIAQDTVPVLTGHLRDSITLESGPDFVRVYTDVVYAGQVEYGGIHNPPEPYMRPAADLVDGEVASVAMKEIIDGV